jgi:uncharacterized protein YbcI
MATSELPEQQETAGRETAVALDGQLGQLTQITRAMVAIYKEQFGRGPRHAHSHYSGPNAVVCFLEGTLTPLERKLAEEGEHQRLREIRLWFQYSAEASFRGAVEAATGRKVVGFISGMDTVTDISIETFVLEPSAHESS